MNDMQHKRFKSSRSGSKSVKVICRLVQAIWRLCGFSHSGLIRCEKIQVNRTQFKSIQANQGVLEHFFIFRTGLRWSRSVKAVKPVMNRRNWTGFTGLSPAWTSLYPFPIPLAAPKLGATAGRSSRSEYLKLLSNCSVQG